VVIGGALVGVVMFESAGCAVSAGTVVVGGAVVGVEV
jgi:hypothetical protein